MTAGTGGAGEGIAFLRKWPWFLELPQGLQALVLGTARERHVAPGTIIARAGEPSTQWYGPDAWAAADICHGSGQRHDLTEEAQLLGLFGRIEQPPAAW